MRRFDVAWLLVWAALSSAWCLSASRELSAAFDEPYYLRWGVTSWRTGSNYDRYTHDYRANGHHHRATNHRTNSNHDHTRCQILPRRVPHVLGQRYGLRRRRSVDESRLARLYLDPHLGIREPRNSLVGMGRERRRQWRNSNRNPGTLDCHYRLRGHRRLRVLGGLLRGAPAPHELRDERPALRDWVTHRSPRPPKTQHFGAMLNGQRQTTARRDHPKPNISAPC